MLSTKYADSIYSQCLFLRVWVWAEPALNEGLKGMSGASKWQAMELVNNKVAPRKKHLIKTALLVILL